MEQTLFENVFQHADTRNARTCIESTGGALVEKGGQRFPHGLCHLYCTCRQTASDP